ncbi:MAG TPA: hypothetical protein PLZ84_00310 [Clostridia bacterium]|nr:hypothetical protein [Clostridia bacterium]
MGNVVSYFIDGNTSKGYKSFYASNLQGLDSIYALTGASGYDCSKILEQLGLYCAVKGFAAEHFWGAKDCFIKGLVLPEKSTALIVRERNDDLSYDDKVEINTIDFGGYIKHDNEQDIDYIIESAYCQAYRIFEQALKIHDEWEKIYIEHMDFSKANEYANCLIDRIYGDKKKDKHAVIKDRFMGAATYEGPKDFIPDITRSIKKRYLIKGRPGTGKSSLLKALVRAGSERGFDIGRYHCGFDPDSLDMVVIRELDVTVFDSTAPHEYFGQWNGDEILDVYEVYIQADTDTRFESELNEIISRYQEKMREGTEMLAKAYSLKKEFEKVIYKRMNENRINEWVEIIMDRIGVKA